MLQCPLSQSWTWIGFIHGLGWIGLDWVQFLVEKIGLGQKSSLTNF